MNNKRKIFCEITGEALELPEYCNRIVSFSPAITESLFFMGHGNKIVGVSVYCVRPPEARTKKILGSYNTFKEKDLKEVNPDIIFTTTGYQWELIKKIKGSYPAYAVALPPTISALIATCVEAGLVAGYANDARKLQKILLQKLCEMTSKSRTNIPRVYVEIDLGGPVTFGTYSYITDGISICGGENIYSSKPVEWMTPDDEYTRAANPDIIIYEPKMFSKNRDFMKIKNWLKDRLGNVDAIKNGKVFITPGIHDFLAHHGPSFILEVMPWMEKCFHEN